MAAAKKSGKEMTVVKGLDVARYMGRWYEIASFPSFFQPRDGENTRATYTLNPDGATIHVLNETWSGGKRDYIEGTAYKADPKSDEASGGSRIFIQEGRKYNNSGGATAAPRPHVDPPLDEAKLKVKFYVPPFLPIIPVVGDYWVLYIDDDYQYAVIGQPSRKYLWILSRKIHIDEEIYNSLVEKAKEEGYDVTKLHKTPQADPPPQSEEGPNDAKGIWWIKSLFGK